jgi:sulfate transport system permease protein
MASIDLPAAAAAPTSRAARSRTLAPGARVGLGVSVIWLSLLVLLPLAAVVVTSSSDGWSGFWATISSDAVASAIRLTVTEALLVTVVNVVTGTLIAWVLVRDDFPGKAVLDTVIDVPFALPTIVAGLVLLSLYGPKSPVGIEIANTRIGIFVALLFVTVPFVVRAVQPVLLELDPEVEQAAASLGAGRLTIFRRIVLPNLLPAIAAGAALAFARAISEYGSLVLMSGNLPGRTEVASVRILVLMENDNRAGAAAVATVLLAVSVLTLVGIDLLQRWAARRA